MLCIYEANDSFVCEYAGVIKGVFVFMCGDSKKYEIQYCNCLPTVLYLSQRLL